MVEQRIVREDAQTRNLQKPRGAMRVMHGFHGTYRPGSRLRSGLPFGGFDAESKRLRKHAEEPPQHRLNEIISKSVLPPTPKSSLNRLDPGWRDFAYCRRGP